MKNIRWLWNLKTASMLILILHGVLTVKSDGFWNTDETLYHKATHNPVKNNFTSLFQNDVEHESCLFSINYNC